MQYNSQAAGLAAAGPRIAQDIPDDTGSGGHDIMVLVDLSRSMQVSDILPTRLRRARIELDDLVQLARGERIGIIVYAAKPHLYVPLTRDFKSLRFYLDSLDKLQLPSNGSNAAAALELAQKHLQNNKNSPAIILITDGDLNGVSDKLNLAREQQISKLKESGIPLYILATGTEEGDAIPIEDGGWLSYEGRPVVSRLNAEVLENMAEQTNGAYTLVRDDNSDWDTLYNNGIAVHNKTTATRPESERVIWQELFVWFLLPAILLFWIATVPYHYSKQAGQTLALILAVGLLPTVHDPLYAAQQDDQIDKRENHAWQAYQSEQYEKAASIYALLGNYRGYMGEGISYYRLSDYQPAMRQFSQAVLAAANDKQRADAVFNLANTYFRTGDYRTAISLYQNTLLYQPQNKQAQYNLKFSQALQDDIDTRLADEQAYANRMGKGPRQARVRKDIEINPAGSVSMGEPSKEEDIKKNTPDKTDTNIQIDSAYEVLLERGIEHLRLAETGQVSRSSQQYKVQRLDINTARLHMQQLQDRPVQLWKRLFEIEEGYPAPLDSARDIPGVQPW